MLVNHMLEHNIKNDYFALFVRAQNFRTAVTSFRKASVFAGTTRAKDQMIKMLSSNEKVIASTMISEFGFCGEQSVQFRMQQNGSRNSVNQVL